MSKILITGSTGFIGKALSAKLQIQGHELALMSSADGDISDPRSLNKVATDKVSHVFHLAGKTFVPDSWNDSNEFFRTNILGTTNVLEFCKSRNISMTFVSAYVYGHPESIPIGEGSKIAPSNPYALSKSMAEKACEFYADVYKLGVTIVRPFNVYGYGQDKKFLIPSIIRQVLNEEKVVVQDLLPRRDYIFLDDLVDALLATKESLKGYRVYNIGSGVSISVREVVDAIQNVAQTNKMVFSEKNVRSNELMNVVADISKAHQELNWKPQHTFREGIARIFNLQN